MQFLAIWNGCHVVDNVPSSLNTVAAMVSTAQPYPELKNSSDMLLVALPMIPSSILPGYLVYLRDTILDRVCVLHPWVLGWLHHSGILQWQQSVSACKYLCADSVSTTISHTADWSVDHVAGLSVLLSQIICTYRTVQCCHTRGLVAAVFKPCIRWHMVDQVSWTQSYYTHFIRLKNLALYTSC